MQVLSIETVYTNSVNCLDIRFVIPIQKSESRHMDLPFLFVKSLIFRARDLTSNAKMR